MSPLSEREVHELGGPALDGPPEVPERRVRDAYAEGELSPLAPDRRTREGAPEGEPLYPCAHPGCEVMRTKAEGGTTFTVCEEHWAEHYGRGTPEGSAGSDSQSGEVRGLVCHHCGEPGTCFGKYEGDTVGYVACDICCGHGNEDGWCVGVEEIVEVLREHYAEIDDAADAPRPRGAPEGDAPPFDAFELQDLASACREMARTFVAKAAWERLAEKCDRAAGLNVTEVYTEAAAREKFAQELEAVGTSAGAWAARYLRSLHTTDAGSRTKGEG